MAVRVDLEKHDRRLFTPTPWGSPSWKRGPSFRPGSIAESTTLTTWRNTTFAACGRLRLGLVTVVAMALGCLRAERNDRMRSLVGPVGLRDRPLRSSDRPPETGCLRSGHGPARPGFAA